MRLPLPDPAALLGAAGDAVEVVLSLGPRFVAAMDRVDALLDRAEAVAARAEAVTARAEAVVEESEQTTARARSVVKSAELVTRNADRAINGVNGVTDRADLVLQTWEPISRRMGPHAERFSAALSGGEVEAAIGIVDRLPVVLEHMETDVLPVLRTLDRVGPDLHEVLEIVEDLRRVVTGLPGVGLLRRRGEDEPPPVEGSVHD